MRPARQVTLLFLVPTLIAVTALAIEVRSRIDLVWSAWVTVRRWGYWQFGRLDFSLFEPVVPPGVETWADFAIVIGGLSTAGALAWLTVVAIAERWPQWSRKS